MTQALAPPHSHIFLGSHHSHNARRTHWVVVLTAVMMVVEIGAGYLTGSMALLADGFHMATHAGALGVAALAYGFAARHAGDRRFSFGTGKVGDLAGFASALGLGLVALGIGWQSLWRMFEPLHVAFEEAALIAILGLVVNIASAFLLGHRHGPDQDHHHGHAHAHSDNNLRAAYLHVLADALTSILAILALLAGRWLGWIWLDPVMGLVGAVVIARWSWALMQDTAATLLDMTDFQIEEEVLDCLDEVRGLDLRDLHIWRLGPDAYGAIVTLASDEPLDAEMVRARLRPVHELAHITVEIQGR